MIRKLLLRFPDFPGARWAISAFVILSTKEAEELSLTHRSNLYGDIINSVNCRSFWVDRQGRMYRVRELVKKTIKAIPPKDYDDDDDYYLFV